MSSVLYYRRVAQLFPVVIIAAGVASRLRPYSGERHKCLMELEPDVTILDFILDRLEKINPDSIYIVIRPQFKDAFKERLKGKVKLVKTDVDEFGNLYSVSLALKHLKRSSFLLLMSDHIFEQSIADKILSSRSQVAFTVCLDKEPSRAEAAEGLKLALREKSVVYTDKKASPRYGIDTGIILCREKSKTYIEKAIGNFGPKATIADALNLAADDGEVDYVDVTGKLWKDIDTPEDLDKGRKIYWQILRKDLAKSGDGLISRYLYKPISTRISIIMYRRGFMIEPLTLTFILFILGLLAGLLLAMREFLLGGLMVQVVSVIGGLKDELTELHRKTVLAAGYVDAVLDRISDITIVAGLTVSALTIDSFTLLLAMLAVANVVLVSYATDNFNSLGVRTKVLGSIPATKDARLFMISVASILSLPMYGLYYLAIAPIFYLSYSLVLALKIRREIKLERIGGEPKPEVLIEKKEVSSRIESLISNSIKLGLALLLINMTAPIISGITLIDFGSFALSSDHLLSTLNLIIIIYFGYRILLALRAMIDVMTRRLVDVVGVTETTLRQVSVDSLYIVLAIALWVYLPSQLKPIPYLGDYLSRLVALIIFVFFLLIFYDLVKLLYKTFGDFFKEIVVKITERLHESIKE